MRKAQAKPRNIKEDPIYKNKLVTKLINRSMRDGEKSVAARQIYAAFDIIAKETGEDALKTFIQAIENIKPSMEVRARRIGGAAYQVPSPVRGTRKESLAIRWLITCANLRPNAQFRSYGAKLAAEIMDAAKSEGAAVGKRKEIERAAESNKAFAHFKW